jgi:endonuclease-8
VPEGDAVHRAARRLRALAGERVSAESPHPRGAATGIARAVDGRVLEGVEEVGKHLLLRFEGGVVLRSHLRMSGRWRVAPAGTPYVGRPWLVLRGETWQAMQWNGPVLELGAGPTARLGPDLLADGTSVEGVVAALRSEHQSRLVGEALLDQQVVSGTGNMWLAEALWHGRVSPWLHLGEAGDEDLSRTLEWARGEMRAAVSGARPSRAVYRRAGRACPRCGTPIRSRGLGDAFAF